MRWLFALIITLLPLFAVAQDTSEEDRGFLTGLLEDNLSGIGRTVRIDGFAGALSSRATFTRMTIADAQGVWLTIERGAIQWNRSALLQGRVEIEEMTAVAVIMDRVPEGEGDHPSVAREFRLPELPVSVDIGTVRADRIALAAPVLGEPVEATLAASLTLEGGEGSATLSLNRTDGKLGTLELNCGYANTSRNLRLDLLAEEGPEGIAARKIGLPGRPAVTLAISGNGPVDDFLAEISLSSDDEPRLTGTARLTQSGPEGAREAGFALDVAGNVMPLFAPEYATFFGPDVRLSAEGRRSAAGTVELRNLSLDTNAVDLAGSLTLAADGLPAAADLSVELGVDGTEVLLPLTGPPTRVRSASLRLGYDAAEGEGWRLSGRLNGLSRPDLSLGTVSLNGSGRISRGRGGASGDTIGGTIGFGLSGLSFTDPAIGEAVGTALVGNVRFFWQRGGGLTLPDFQVAGDGFSATGRLAVAGLETGLTTRGRISATYADLGRLSAIAGRPLGGRATLTAEGSASLLGGAFDIVASVEGENLSATQPELDNLLRGESRIDVSAMRDTEATEVRYLTLRAATLQANLAGTVSPEAEDLTATLEFSDLSALGPQFRGSLAASGTLVRSGGVRQIRLSGSGTRIGVGQPELDRVLAGPATLSLQATEQDGTVTITAFALDNPQLSATASGSIGTAGGTARLEARLSDMALLAPGFPGALSLTADISGTGSGYDLTVSADGPGGTTARGGGTVSAGFDSVDLDFSGGAQLAILNPFIAPRNIVGPVSFEVSVSGRPSLGSLSGRVSTGGARFAEPALGIALEDISATAVISGGTARTDITAAVRGGGGITASGSVGLQRPFPTDLAISLNRVRLRDRGLYETRVSGQLAFTGDALGAARLEGDLRLGETEIRIPSTGLGATPFAGEIIHRNEPADVYATRVRAGLAGTDGEGRARPPIALDIALSAPERIFVRGRGLDAELGGSLRIGGTLSDIQPVGEFNLIRGRLDILGKRFDFDEGRVQLQGALIPYIDFSATSRNEGITAFVRVQGPANEPRILFESQPPLPEEEVVSQLLFGRGLDNLSAFQAAQLASAVATLSGRGGEGVVGRLRNSFGLDDLDIQTDADGNVALRAGKYLSRNLYTDLQVDAEGKSEITLNLDVSESVTVRGVLGSDGDTGIGVYYERDY